MGLLPCGVTVCGVGHRHHRIDCVSLSHSSFAPACNNSVTGGAGWQQRCSADLQTQASVPESSRGFPGQASQAAARTLKLRQTSRESAESPQGSVGDLSRGDDVTGGSDTHLPALSEGAAG